jgi:hypothetical protein
MYLLDKVDRDISYILKEHYGYLDSVDMYRLHLEYIYQVIHMDSF